jgi:glutaredoxin-like protein NrdH
MNIDTRLPIVVYSKPGCQQCNAVERWLNSRGFHFKKIDVTLHEAAAEKVRDMGYLQVPVTVIPFDYSTDGPRHFYGFDIGALSAIR